MGGPQLAPVPSVTVTEPVGDPVAGDAGATVKLTVTGCPVPEGAGESPVIDVVVLPLIVSEAVPLLSTCAPDPP